MCAYFFAKLTPSLTFPSVVFHPTTATPKSKKTCGHHTPTTSGIIIAGKWSVGKQVDWSRRDVVFLPSGKPWKTTNTPRRGCGGIKGEHEYAFANWACATEILSFFIRVDVILSVGMCVLFCECVLRKFFFLLFWMISEKIYKLWIWKFQTKCHICFARQIRPRFSSQKQSYINNTVTVTLQMSRRSDKFVHPWHNTFITLQSFSRPTAAEGDIFRDYSESPFLAVQGGYKMPKSLPGTTRANEGKYNVLASYAKLFSLTW